MTIFFERRRPLALAMGIAGQPVGATERTSSSLIDCVALYNHRDGRTDVARQPQRGLPVRFPPCLVAKVPTLWTNSYFVATTGGAPLAAIKQYVENQKHV